MLHCFTVSNPKSGDALGPSPDDMGRGDAARMRRHLRALLQVSQATRTELDPAHQTRLVVDELVQALGAERGFLFLVDEHGYLELRAGRGASGEDLGEDAGYSRNVVEEVIDLGRIRVVNRTGDWGSGAGQSAELRSLLAAPMHLHDRVVGVVYVDSRVAKGMFSRQDGDVLAALASQVPVALELAKALRTQAEQREALEQARKLEAVGTLAGGIAHDFNNTLALIMAAVDNLEKDGGASWTHYVGAIRSACERGAALTRQLLAVSRRQVFDPTRIQVNEVAQDVAQMVDRLLGTKVEVHTAFADDLWDVVADSGQLEQVLINLMVNACDALPEGGKVRVETQNVPGDVRTGGPHWVQIAVSDDGVGMDEATRARIFEPFFSTKPQGTGLGLATTYGIVQQHRGTIQVTSKPGSGARFEVRLPAASAGGSASDSDEYPVRGEETLLYVEDDPEVRTMLAQMLGELGYRVLAAGSGTEALEIAAKQTVPIEMVITDVVMPGMDGPELCRRLRSVSPGAKVLYVSGYTAGALDSRGIIREGAGFLQKPFSSRTLARRVRELLSGDA